MHGGVKLMVMSDTYLSDEWWLLEWIDNGAKWHSFEWWVMSDACCECQAFRKKSKQKPTCTWYGQKLKVESYNGYYLLNSILFLHPFFNIV